MSDNTALSALDVLTRCGSYARWLYDLAAPYLGRRVVEMGAGLGTQSEVMLAAPGSELREFLLTDADPARAETLKGRFGSRSNVTAGTWTLPEPFRSDRARGGEFRPDTFVGWNVLEHVHDDTRALAEMRKALEPGGRAVVFSPAGPELFSGLDREMGHFRRYARGELAQKAERTGLVPLVERRVNLVGGIGWLVTAKILRRGELPEAPSRLFDLLVPIVRLWEDRLPVPWGLSVVFVAKRP